MPIDFVVDAFWGSGGKGKVSAAYAAKKEIKILSTSNHPNAGHTYRDRDKTFVFKILHSAAALGECDCFISADSVIDPLQLSLELRENPDAMVGIHERAIIRTHCDIKDEQINHANIASTMQGGCAASVRKMQRPLLGRHDVGILEDYDQFPYLNEFFDSGQLCIMGNNEFFRQIFRAAEHDRVLHEVAQGYALSIDHGTHYPHCTYRNCLVASALDDLGLPPKLVGDVILVVRTFPIRVGNLDEYSSGDFPPDCRETTWDEIFQRAGFPESERKPEFTTVTKRQRRVATPSYETLQRAALQNGATGSVITFIEYLGWENREAKTFSDLNARAKQYIDQVEEITEAPVIGVSTGPMHEDMIWRQM
jgi:adenylosuccinate synthase